MDNDRMCFEYDSKTGRAHCDNCTRLEGQLGELREQLEAATAAKVTLTVSLVDPEHKLDHEQVTAAMIDFINYLGGWRAPGVPL